MQKPSVNSGVKHNFVTLCLLSFAGSIIYGLPYFRLYYYDSYQQIYHLTNVQMGLLGSAYGILGVFSYVIGGILADRFPAKWLLIFSMLATGAGGFLHLIFSDFHALILIYCLWGFTSLLFFWPALMKVVRIQGTDSEQSRVYGIFEGGRGIFNAIHLAVATAIFGVFQAKALVVMGIKWIIVFYSLAPVLCGILFIFLLQQPEKTDARGNTDTFSLQQIWQVMKLPAIWLVVIMVFCSYTFNMSIYYFTPYASNIIGTTAVVAAIISVLQQYCRPFAAIIGGFLADKMGKGQLMLAGFVLMAMGTLLMYLVPQLAGSGQMVLIVMAAIIIYIGMFSNFGLYFAFLSEGRIPVQVAGMAIGIVSTFGYLPEVITPFIAGKILDTFHGATGYYIYFAFMLTMSLVGMIFCVIWIGRYGKKSDTESTETVSAAINEG